MTSQSLNPLTYAQVRLLAVLALINFVNFADREVFNPLVPLLRQHFGVSDTQLGSLQTVLLIVLALASIPFGFLADRFSQPKIIALRRAFLECRFPRQWPCAHVFPVACCAWALLAWAKPLTHPRRKP